MLCALLRVPLEALEAGAVEVVTPLMRAIVERAEALLLQMHEQGYGDEDAPEVAQASRCILDLSRHLSHSRSGPQSIIQTLKLLWCRVFVVLCMAASAFIPTHLNAMLTLQVTCPMGSFEALQAQT